MFKRLCGILCAAVILVTCGVFAVIAEDSAPKEVPTSWKNYAGLLSEIGVIDDYNEETYGFYAPIGRAEFVASMTGFYGDAVLPGRTTTFSNVPASYWAVNEIAFAGDMNLISTATPLFEPERIIKVEEAVKIAVSLLGYGSVAENRGGYPLGYMAIGANLGLLNDVNISGDMVRGNMLSLMNNMLEVKVLENESVGGDLLKAGKSLEESLGIYSLRGVVTGNATIALDGATTTAENEIMIEGNRYIYDKGDECIGRRVRIHYRYDKEAEQNRILYLQYADDGILKLDSKDIETFTSSELTYYNENNKLETLNISRDVEVVYNGRKEISLPAELFIPNEGRIEMYDNDVDGIYDVVSITSFDEILINVFNKRDLKIYDKIDKSKELDLSENFKSLLVVIDGEEKALTDLTSDMLISVAISRDGKVGKIYASTTKLDGRADEYTEEELIVGEKTYEFSKVFIENDKYNVNMNNANVYYINSFGKIAYAESGTVKTYGYIIGIDRKGSISNTVEIKMLSNEGKIVIYKVADKVLLNGTKKDAVAVLSNNSLFPGGAFSEQLCMYALNADGEISKLNVVGPNADSTNALTLEYDSGDTFVSYRAYKTSAVMLNKYLFEGSTKVFLIGDDEKDMTLTTRDALAPDSAYKVKLYNYANCVVGACVIDNRSGGAGGTAINLESGTYVVKDVVRAIDEETGEEITKMYAYLNGKLVDLYPEDDDVKGNAASTLFADVYFKDLKPGDVFQPSTSSSGRINSFRLVFGMNRGMKGETEVCYSESSVIIHTGKLSDKYAKMYNLCGYVTDIHSDTILKVNTIKGTDIDIGDIPESEFERVLSRNAAGPVYLYDSKKDDVLVIDASEIIAGDYIYARTRYTLTEELYVVR